MQPFDDLYATFSRDEQLAKDLISPNAQDTLEIKIAIVGFCYTTPSEAWSIDEYKFVNQFLTECVGFSPKERLFYALGLGYIVGLKLSQKVDPLNYNILLAQLPGFIYEKGGMF